MDSTEGGMDFGRPSNPNPSSSSSSGDESERGSENLGNLGEMELSAVTALANFAQISKIGREEGEEIGRRLKGFEKGSRRWRSSKDLNLSVPKAEREAKRIRRMLANRESARQTIRRRQAFREELFQKVSYLSAENENLKTEKELITKASLLLKDRNKELKAQMDKAMKGKLDAEAETESRSQLTELSLAAQSRGLCMPHGWAPPWPSISPEAGDVSSIAASRAFYYVLPCAWLCPLLPQTSVLSSSEKGVDFINKGHAFMHHRQADDNSERGCPGCGIKTDVCLVEKRVPVAKLSEEIPVEFSLHNLLSEPDQGGTVAAPSHFKNPRPTVNNEEKEVTPSKSQLSGFRPFKKSVDQASAAAARKRRTELRKLKDICRRQN